MLLKTFLTNNNILTDAQAEAIAYLGTAGMEKVQNIMMMKYPQRPILVSDSDTTLVTDIQKYCNTVFVMHDYNWTKKYATLALAYNPLNATDINETTADTNSGSDTHSHSTENSGADTTAKTETHSGTDTTSDSGTNTGTVSESDTLTHNTADATSKRSYDDNTMTETESTAKTGTDTDAKTTTNNLADSNTETLQHGHEIADSETMTHGHKITESATDNFGHVLTQNKTVTGRDNRTPQEMIMQERAVAEYNFFEMIADEVTDFITTLSYDFSSEEGESYGY